MASSTADRVWKKARSATNGLDPDARRCVFLLIHERGGFYLDGIDLQRGRCPMKIAGAEKPMENNS